MKSISAKEYAQNGTAHCKIRRAHFTILLLEREDVPKENGAVMKKTTMLSGFFYYDRIFENMYMRSSIVKIAKTDSPNKGMTAPSITIMIKKMNMLFLSFCFGGAANFLSVFLLTTFLFLINKK